jgi:hypothetical protein
MVPISNDITLNAIAVRKLEGLPSVMVQQLSQHDSGWDLPDSLLPSFHGFFWYGTVEKK